jgi:hypothetical protein
VEEGNSQSFSETLKENYLKGSRRMRVGEGVRCKTCDGYTRMCIRIKKLALDTGIEGEDWMCPRRSPRLWRGLKWKGTECIIAGRKILCVRIVL